MADSYQAIYDAVRSRISGGNVGEAIESVARDALDMSYPRQLLQEQITSIGYEMSRPSTVYRPTLRPDGDMWCTLFGDNLQEGVAGFGETPGKAFTDFDNAWWSQRTPQAMRTETTNG